MGRSVVLGGAPRCARCLLPHRWCICEAITPVHVPLDVNVLIHHREFFKPTSTGKLIERLLPSARLSVYQHDLPIVPENVIRTSKPLWILHPSGDPLPELTRPEEVQVLLLDGAWREATRMMHEVRSWGRLINLPMRGPSRYWLRGQQEEGTYSTFEALLFVLKALGLHSQHEQLSRQFELHVYAGLKSRGDKAGAERYLAESPIRTAYADLIARLNVRRPSGA